MKQTRFAALFILACSFAGVSTAAVADGGRADHEIVRNFQVPDGLPFDATYRQTFSQVAGPIFSGMHWNHHVCVYASQDAAVYLANSEEFQRYFAAADEWLEDLPEPTYGKFTPGTVIIKENFWDVDGKPNRAHSLTVMIKREPGYAPEFGDWEYLELDQSGKQRLRGNAQQSDIAMRCANCHNSVADRDYVFAIETTTGSSEVQSCAAH